MKRPDQVRAEFKRLEWDHRRNFRDHLLGARPCSECSLSPPTSAAAIDNIPEYRAFIEGWREVDRQLPGRVIWESRKLRVLLEQELPVRIRLPTIVDLAQFIGADATARLRRIYERLKPLRALGEQLGRTAEANIHRIEAMPDADFQCLLRALPQLHRDMGVGTTTLRTLPLDGVDTKLVERYEGLIEILLEGWQDVDVSTSGGLRAWLGCVEKGQDRLMVKPLGTDMLAAFYGASQFWVTSQTLTAMAMPGTHVLVIENNDSGLNLPVIEGAIAVIGTGGNLDWLTAPWIRNRRVIYWGDIDSWGLQLLATARRKAPQTVSVMMDIATWSAHPECVVIEPESCEVPDAWLTPEEIRLRETLKGHLTGHARLEQEKLRQEWINANLVTCFNGQSTSGHANADTKDGATE